MEVELPAKGQPFPEHFVLITPKGFSDLEKMIQRFHTFECNFYYKEYIEKRTKVLLQNMKKSLPATSLKDEEATQPGTHYYNYILHCTLKLLQVRIINFQVIKTIPFHNYYCVY